MSRRGLCRNFFCKNGENSRYFAFSAEPEKSCTQVHWVFQNLPRKTQSHRILAVLGKNNLPERQISLSKTISLRKQYHAVGISLPKAHRDKGTSLCRQAKTSQHCFYKVTLPEEASHNFVFEIALKTAYFQRIYFFVFPF